MSYNRRITALTDFVSVLVCSQLRAKILTAMLSLRHFHRFSIFFEESFVAPKCELLNYQEPKPNFTSGVLSKPKKINW